MPTSFPTLSTNGVPFQTRQALLILGLQNDFLSADAKLSVDAASGFLERITALAPKFRSQGDVYWIRTEFKAYRPVNASSGQSDTVVLSGPSQRLDEGASFVEGENARSLTDIAQGQSPTPARAGDVTVAADTHFQSLESKPPKTNGNSASSADDELFLSVPSDRAPLCIPHSPGADLVDCVKGLVDMSKDVELTTTYYSAFKETSLLLKLRARMVTEVYICGCLTNMSVYATAMDAARHGLAINIIDDCLGYHEVSRHEEALRKMTEFMGAYMVDSRELLHEFRYETKTGETPSRRDSTDLVKLQDLLRKGKMREGQELPQTGRQAWRSGASRHAQIRQPEAQPTVDAADVSDPTGLPATRDQLENAEQFESTDYAFAASRRRLATNRPLSGQSTASVSSDGSGRRMVQNKIRVRKSLQGGEQRPRRVTAESTSNGHQDKPPLRGASSLSQSLAKEGLSSVIDDSSLVGPVLEPRLGSTPVPTAGLDPVAASAASMANLSLSSSPTGQSAVPSDELVPPMAKGLPSAFQPLSPISAIGPRSQTLASLPALSPGDHIAEGDSHIVQNFIPPALCHNIYQKLSEEVQFQKMYHADGEVPRLVAVQGKIHSDGSMPIYRHPSDHAPMLLPFSPTVQVIREAVERVLGHPVNHALIQLYRGGDDNISEHSDKTLDIVRGSSIANVSFGAQRTMRLRTKRSAGGWPYGSVTGTRQTQRVRMPHNSVFILGPKTNMRWLHGIQPDRRLATERSPAEKAFDGRRISLTFRNIGTHLDREQQHIWGQGARSKSQAKSREVVSADANETERMIHAFGVENRSSEFDWVKVYGSGFDVLHFKAPHPSSQEQKPTPSYIFAPNQDNPLHRMTNISVLIYMEELGLQFRLVEPSTKLLAVKQTGREEAATFQDVDEDCTKVQGLLPMLLYLERYYGGLGQSSRVTSAEAYRLLFVPLVSGVSVLDDLLQVVEGHESSVSITPRVEEQLRPLNSTLDDRRLFLAGNEFSIADCVYWPVLNELMRTSSWKAIGENYRNLELWSERVKERDSVLRALERNPLRDPLTTREQALSKIANDPAEKVSAPKDSTIDSTVNDAGASTSVLSESDPINTAVPESTPSDKTASDSASSKVQATSSGEVPP